MRPFEKARVAYSDQIKQFPLIFIGETTGKEIVGWGAVKMTGVQCKDAGIKNALLVTTGLKGTGIVEEVQAICKAAEVETSIWKVGQTNPRLEDVDGGVQAFKDAGADGILSVGGGSSHDTGKMIRMLLDNPGLELDSYPIELDPPSSTWFDKIKPPQYPQVSVNTTAGTGAEMTGFGVVTNWEAHWKYAVFCKNVSPAWGINDPALLRTMPPHLAAQTGMDAFIHGQGGVVSRLQSRVSVAVGLEAARLVWENLPEFVYNRRNDKACEAMAWAQYLAALTYALGGGAGPIHAHAHQISAVNNMHHGLSNAIMMIPVMKFIYPAAPERYATLARDVMRMDISNMDRMQAAEAFIERLEAFRNIVGITAEDCKLSKYNLTEANFKHMTPHAYMDFCNEASVRDIYEEDVMNIYLSTL